MTLIGSSNSFFGWLPGGVTVTVGASDTGIHLWVYAPGGEVAAEDEDESGFIGGNASSSQPRSQPAMSLLWKAGWL